MRKDSWLEIEELLAEFNELGINKAVDYDKYYLYSLITHSTAIEGSTLTEVETQLLFDEGITANGKPLVYHLMNEDLKQAYEYVIEEAKQHKPVTPLFLQRLSGIGGRSYMNYQKVSVKVDELCVLFLGRREWANGTAVDELHSICVSDISDEAFQRRSWRLYLGFEKITR